MIGTNNKFVYIVQLVFAIIVKQLVHKPNTYNTTNSIS